VEVVANIGSAESAHAALEFGAEGVGLLRTEFIFLDRTTLPDEEEQYAIYTAIADVMGERPLVIRTFDIGGDKPPSYMEWAKETNPFLGWRAIRVSLAHTEMFKVQLRAILRAGWGHNIKIMFPMIATIEELRQARRCLDEARSELKAHGAPFAEKVEMGIMVEIPSAAFTTQFLAREADFFSIGTNDLIQYTFAADRTNEKVGYLYEPLHPAILHVLKKIIDDAHHAGKWVGMCGEMAGDLNAVPLLLGLGLDEFSVNASAIPEVKSLIRSLELPRMQELAGQVLELATAADIRARVLEITKTEAKPAR
jgi:phosphotransferase system enzyme I (PtsI)